MAHTDIDRPAHNACNEWDNICDTLNSCNMDAAHEFITQDDYLYIDCYGDRDTELGVDANYPSMIFD